MLSFALLYHLGQVLPLSGPDMPCLDKDRVLWPLRSFLILEFCGFENGLKEQAGRGWGNGGGSCVQER